MNNEMRRAMLEHLFLGESPISCFAVWLSRAFWIAPCFMTWGAEPLVAYQLRVPEPRSYWVSQAADWLTPSLGPIADELSIRNAPDAAAISRIDSRVIIHLKPEARLESFGWLDHWGELKTLPYTDTYLLQTGSPQDGLQVASRLAEYQEVIAAYPVESRSLHFQPRSLYASEPDDTYFSHQWYLDQRDRDYQKLGVDLNVRAAWPLIRDRHVSLSIVDTGVSMEHPDLEQAVGGAQHHNFISGENDGAPISSTLFHGTAVAGLMGATHDNQAGIAGMLPNVSLASWVIFGLGGTIADSLQLAEMYETDPDTIQVQNHSWGNAYPQQEGPSFIERMAISNAFFSGRSGKGTLMVRAGGNDRISGDFHPGLGDANDDAYTSMHQSIAVAATDREGKATSYSNWGACLLVAAPGGDSQDGLFTTDLLGRRGYISSSSEIGKGDYIPNEVGFIGTSAAAPLVSSMAGMALAVAPTLGARDVQQILVAASRQVFAEDPDIHLNGAGFEHSHNVGFGIPDAAEVVRLASSWKPRQEMVVKSFSTQPLKLIPDGGLKVAVSGVLVPDHLKLIPASTTMGLQPDRPTGMRQVSHAGMVVAELDEDFTGKGVLIQRGVETFERKIRYAADAGAAFAIIYNNQNQDELVRMAGTDYSPIPAFFISKAHGDELVDLMGRDPNMRMELMMESFEHVFDVSDDLICEHVELIVDADHTYRGQLRITLESPSGSISVLQRLNHDESLGPIRWAYRSTRHFFEPTAGQWKVRITDQDEGEIGTLRALRLSLMGTAIEDTDHDGLNDSWERRHFGNLRSSGAGDADQDGYSNAREQLLQTDPTVSDYTLQVAVTALGEGRLRLQWPTRLGHLYRVLAWDKLGQEAREVSVIQSTGSSAEWIVPLDASDQGFYQIEQLERP